MPSQFAKTTTVSAKSSRDEIEATLLRYGVIKMATLQDGRGFAIGFELRGRRYRLEVPHPIREDFKNDSHFEQAIRTRWRVLLLLLKAKLESIECGLSTFEQEFLPQTILPGTNRTVSDYLPAEIERAYLENKTPQLLLEGPSA